MITFGMHGVLELGVWRTSGDQVQCGAYCSFKKNCRHHSSTSLENSFYFCKAEIAAFCNITLRATSNLKRIASYDKNLLKWLCSTSVFSMCKILFLYSKKMKSLSKLKHHASTKVIGGFRMGSFAHFSPNFRLSQVFILSYPNIAFYLLQWTCYPCSSC